MSITRLTAVAAALLSVSAPAVAESPHRYAVEVSVVRGGVELFQARTLIAEPGQAQATLSDGDQTYAFTADLAPAPGEPLLGRLRLQGRLTVDGEKLAAPTIVFDRNSRTSVSIREDGADVFVTVAPVIERTADRGRRPE